LAVLQCVPQAASLSLSYVYYVPVAGVPVGDAAYVNIATARVAVDTESELLHQNGH
jgi:hypothetical protein